MNALQELRDALTLYDIPRIIKAAQGVVEAEEDGRVVELPCKVGDTVYKLWYEPCHNGEYRPDGMGCAGCIDECDIKPAVVPFTANSVEHIVGMRNSLNQLWFLTREQAEAALKGADDER